MLQSLQRRCAAWVLTDEAHRQCGTASVAVGVRHAAGVVPGVDGAHHVGLDDVGADDAADEAGAGAGGAPLVGGRLHWCHVSGHVTAQRHGGARDVVCTSRRVNVVDDDDRQGVGWEGGGGGEQTHLLGLVECIYIQVFQCPIY